MPNRTEILHFRATPEEKGRIEENAGHAELHLSEWMRQRSLDRLAPTQPVVEKSEGLKYSAMNVGLNERDELVVIDPELPIEVKFETYEEFMERRVPELCGENPSVAEVGDAEITARAEWAEQEPL